MATHDDPNQSPRPRRARPALREGAHELRHAPTPAEQLLWQALRRQQVGVKFRRQHPIGRFIADFCCLERRLIVEVDGKVHDQQADYDQARTDALLALGFQVLRFSNRQVLHERAAVLAQIRQALSVQLDTDETNV